MYIKYKDSSLILVFLVVQYSHSQRPKSPRMGNKTDVATSLYIELSDVNCTHFAPQFIESIECYQIRRNNSSYITATLLLQQPVTQFDTNIALDVLRPSKNFVNIFRTNVDCCALLSAKEHNIYVVNNVFKLIYATFKESPSCPLRPHYNYTIKEFNTNQIKLPNYVPRTKFRLGLYFRTDGRRSVDVVMQGRIRNSN